jgi:hypothetical protein
MHMTGVLARSTIIDLPAKEDRMMPNIDSIIRDHVTLTVRCLDRIYLQGYIPKLQTSGGLCYFLRDHLGHPIPSPALFRPMHDRFVAAIKTFAADHAVPLIAFESGQDKDAIVATHRAHFRGEDGVVVIGVAQEKARAFKAHQRTSPQGGVPFDFTRQSVIREILDLGRREVQRRHYARARGRSLKTIAVLEPAPAPRRDSDDLSWAISVNAFRLVARPRTARPKLPPTRGPKEIH